MIDRGASDLHITAGTPPQLRVDGSLAPLKANALSPADTKELCYSILTDGQRQRFEENKELDLSFGIRGLSRFRSNIFVQKGAVAGAFRTIPYRIPGMKELGLPVDSREYGIGAQILNDLGITTMRLMTNNPSKYGGLEGFGLEITGREHLETIANPENIDYLRTKRERLGHLIEGLEDD